MNPTAPLTRSALALGFVLAATLGASAQEGIYVQGTGFADIREFGGTDTALGSASGDIGGFAGPSAAQIALFANPFTSDATGAGGSIRVGTWLHPRWTIDAGLDVGTRTTVDLNPFGPTGLPRQILPLDFSASSRFTAVTTTVGYHQRAGPRLHLGYRAGFSFVRSTYRMQFPDFAPLVTTLTGDPLFAIIDLPPIFERRTLTTKQNHGALALGFEAAWRISDNLAIVPEVRALAFSVPSSGVFLIRPGAGVRWQF